MAAITSAASTVVARPAFVGKTESLRARAVAPAAPKRASVVTLASAEQTSRRAALSVFTVSKTRSGRGSWEGRVDACVHECQRRRGSGRARGAAGLGVAGNGRWHGKKNPLVGFSPVPRSGTPGSLSLLRHATTHRY